MAYTKGPGGEARYNIHINLGTRIAFHTLTKTTYHSLFSIACNTEELGNGLGMSLVQYSGTSLLWTPFGQLKMS